MNIITIIKRRFALTTKGAKDFCKGVLMTISTGLAIMLIIRIPDEERLMIERFGEQYRAYMKRTKRLIPFIF